MHLKDLEMDGNRPATYLPTYLQRCHYYIELHMEVETLSHLFALSAYAAAWLAAILMK